MLNSRMSLNGPNRTGTGASSDFVSQEPNDEC